MTETKLRLSASTLAEFEQNRSNFADMLGREETETVLLMQGDP
jgi:hypothetical protein